MFHEDDLQKMPSRFFLWEYAENIYKTNVVFHLKEVKNIFHFKG